MENWIEHQGLASVATRPNAKTALVGSSSGWIIQVQSGKTAHVLVASRSRRPRVFRKMETATDYLKTLGVTCFMVQSQAFDLPVHRAARRRPDRSDALKTTHQQANEYDKWFASEVKTAIREADSPSAQWVDDKTMQARWKAKRAELLAAAKR